MLQFPCMEVVEQDYNNQQLLAGTIAADTVQYQSPQVNEHTDCTHQGCEAPPGNTTITQLLKRYLN